MKISTVHKVGNFALNVLVFTVLYVFFGFIADPATRFEEFVVFTITVVAHAIVRREWRI